MQQDVFMVYAGLTNQIKEHLLEQQCMSGFHFSVCVLEMTAFTCFNKSHDPTQSYTCSSPPQKL